MNPRTSSTTRLVAVAAAGLVVVSSLAACGKGARTDANPGAPTGTTAAPTTAPPSTGGATPSTPPPATATTVAGNAGAYPSVITNEVVDNPALNKFEATMTARMQKVGLPGVSLLVIQHGKLVEQEAWMAYDLDTVVPIASASKWLTAATIMTLVDAGKIELDKPISTYLDYAEGRFGTITMRQLLSLTSGIKDDEQIPCTKDMAVTLDECNRQIATLPLDSDPGQVFRYGGQHMHVAASVAEAVTGQRWVDIFQAQIARPLGMTHTKFRGGAIFYPNASEDHPSPAGSAESTLGDYGRFLEMIAHDGVAPDGTRLLKSETVAEMQTSQIDDVKRYNGPPYRNVEHNPYALGEWLDWADKDNKAIVLSSDGAFGFRPWIDKQNDIVGVYLIQDTGAGVVEGDPRDTADASDVPTSGPWVFEDVAEALGGSLPKDKTPGPQIGRSGG